MSLNFFFYANPYQPRSLEAAKALNSSLLQRGATIYADPWLAGQNVGQACAISSLPEDTGAVICFGGDGTLLRAAPMAAAKGLPLLGVHTGTVGFLMPGDANDPETLAQMLVTGGLFRQSHPMLEVTLNGRRYLCLNDVSVARGEHPGVIETAVFADGELIFRPRGDGIVIATPLGSTAYALAAGGPMIRPDVSCITLAPLCPRELLLRPTLLPMDAKITVTAQGSPRRRLQIALDGQTLIPIESEITLQISKAAEQALLLSPEPPRFFHTLRQKQYAWNRRQEEDFSP